MDWRSLRWSCVLMRMVLARGRSLDEGSDFWPGTASSSSKKPVKLQQTAGPSGLQEPQEEDLIYREDHGKSEAIGPARTLGRYAVRLTSGVVQAPGSIIRRQSFCRPQRHDAKPPEVKQLLYDHNTRHRKR